MRYYVYISESKVNMLFAQIPLALRDRIAAELKIDVKLVSFSLSERPSDQSKYSKVQLVCDYLERESLVGTLDEPASFLYATLPMRWGPVRNAGIPHQDTGVVFFASATESRVVVLGGSVKHVIGASGPEASVGSHTTGIFGAIAVEEGEVSADAWRTGPDDTLNALRGLATVPESMTGPEQRLEFVAKVLLQGEIEHERGPQVTERRNVLLASPIYVALVE